MHSHPFAGPAPFAHLPPNDKKQGEHRKGQPLELYHPTTGRNSKLGRKVEKPADPRAGGPSGQQDAGKHDTKHTNK